MPFEKDNPWVFKAKPEDEKLSKNLNCKVSHQTYSKVRRIPKWQDYLRDEVFPQMILKDRRKKIFQIKVTLFVLLDIFPDLLGEELPQEDSDLSLNLN